MSELLDNSRHRIETLKGIIKQLHDGADPESLKEEFGDLLAEVGVGEIAAMESTGSYWKPVWNILEGHVRLLLANVKHVRALPGEKTDRKDGQRLASLLRHGLVPFGGWALA